MTRAESQGLNRTYDVAIVGGAGFYGQKVAIAIFKVARNPQSLKLCVVGKNINELDNARQTIFFASAAQVPIENISAVVADAFKSSDMDDVASKSRVLLATLPDYRAVGGTIMAACYKASTHYCDLSLETDLHHHLQTLMNKDDLKKCAIICPYCGYDYVVADFCVALIEAMAAKQQQRKRLTHVESIMTVTTGEAGMVLRESTFFALLERMNHPKIIPTQRQQDTSLGTASVWPLIKWSKSAHKYTIPGPRSEIDVVHSTHNLLQSIPRLAYTSRLGAKSLLGALMYILGMIMFMVAKFYLFRRFLAVVGAPVLVYFGLLTRDAHRYEASLKQMQIQKIFIGTFQAWEGNEPSAEEPLLEIVASGSTVTPYSLALAAVVLLEEGEKVNISAQGGFTTPFAAFKDTSYWDRLVSESGIEIRELSSGNDRIKKRN